ncbi:iron chelate uptake ABC transporter family permease subunit, partial [Paenibacillus maysiensis]|uniref:iron chelate uptake ABC transporter family permease subunit n=1 Tax=Paenibacillus maysiensis TaxID=1155954 RepID=UPI0012DC8C6B
RHRYLLPGAAMIGALILVLADALGRGLKPPLEIPAGIVTAIIGAPYFLYLLLRERKQKGNG